METKVALSREDDYTIICESSPLNYKITVEVY